MTDLTLFDLFELTEAPGETIATAIHGPEPMRGHISVVDPTATSTRHTSLVDFSGGYLQLYAGTSVTFTPETAQQLGQALIDWAEMRKPVER